MEATHILAAEEKIARSSAGSQFVNMDTLGAHSMYNFHVVGAKKPPTGPTEMKSTAPVKHISDDDDYDSDDEDIAAVDNYLKITGAHKQHAGGYEVENTQCATQCEAGGCSIS